MDRLYGEFIRCTMMAFETIFLIICKCRLSKMFEWKMFSNTDNFIIFLCHNVMISETAFFGLSRTVKALWNA